MLGKKYHFLFKCFLLITLFIPWNIYEEIMYSLFGERSRNSGFRPKVANTIDKIQKEEEKWMKWCSLVGVFQNTMTQCIWMAIRPMKSSTLPADNSISNTKRKKKWNRISLFLQSALIRWWKSYEPAKRGWKEAEKEIAGSNGSVHILDDGEKYEGCDGCGDEGTI